jgi:ubiquitin carboxyl-terminal hydrolase 40
MILLVCKRNVKDRTYGSKHEFKFTFPEKENPTIPHLTEACRQHLGLAPSERVSISKYVPHAFEWKWLNPDEVLIEKRGKKNKIEVKLPAAEQDLRKPPYMLKDGDIIGLRVDSEEGAHEDDFQTEADQIAKEEFRVEQEKERAERQKNQGGTGKKKGQPEHGIKFNVDF